jgi:hypothetical protein
MEEIFKRVERFHSLFLEELEAAYTDCQHVTNILSWFNRLDELTKALARGDGTYRQVEDHIFELKVANYLLKTFPGCVITYEPKGVRHEGKNCDLEIRFGSVRYLLEVKCFHPEWEKAKIPAQHIAENNEVIMDGESYHTYQATRGHLLDVTRHAEEKIENYNQPFTSVLAVPDGFHLNIEDLRDFVFIYRHGRPRPDDPLGPMTMHNLDQPFKGTIDQFWAFPFPQESFSLEPNSHATVVAPLMHHDTEVEL